ncbi:AMP-binding protein [Nonomuraea pusilla]|uniref:class I adenylate-forming enzyme family protein n=1 Tax=Nonomuraea pusilla TaxID=46177 RepID=UPI00332BF324
MSEHTLGRLAEEAWNRFDDHDAVFSAGVWHRAHALAARARRMCGGLAEAGIAPGDRVVVALPNVPELPLALQAVWSAGAVATPVVPGAGDPRHVLTDRLRHVLADSGARAVVTSPGLDRTVRAAAGDVPVFAGTAELERAPERGPVRRDPGDLAVLAYTSGTTGPAKGVMLGHGALWHVARDACALSRQDGVDRGLVPVPLTHAYGMAVWLAGLHAPAPRQTALMDGFEPDGFLRLAAELRAGFGAVTPAMIRTLLAEPLEDHPLPDLAYLTCGAEPLGRRTIAEFERRMSGVVVLEGYGMTETGAVTSFNPPGRRRVGSVGLPLAGHAVTVRDADGAPVEPGDLGEICVSGDRLMLGYWAGGRPGPGDAALVDGELRTGDVGCVDDDGYLYVVDRKRDAIVRGGFTVFPREVEDALDAHPDVVMSGVVGRPDPAVGQEVVAFVQLRTGAAATAGELAAWAAERVGRVRRPSEVVLADALPLTPALKLDRAALRARLG